MSDEYNKKMENLNNVVKNTKKKPNSNNRKNNSRKKNNYRRNSQSYKKTPMPKKEDFDDEDDEEDEEGEQNSSQNRRSNNKKSNNKKNNNNNQQNGQGNNGSGNGGSGNGAPGSGHSGQNGSNGGSGSGNGSGSGSNSGSSQGSGSGGNSGTGSGSGANGAGNGGATGGSTGASGGAGTGTGTSAGAGSGAGASSGASAGAGSSAAGAGSGAAAGGSSAAAGSGAAAGTGAAAGSSAAGGAAATGGGVAIGTVLIWVVIVVIVILMLIGFLSFFIGGAGLIRDMLLKFADGIWTNVYGFFVGQDKAQVKEEHIINVADYLEEMGYDLVNYGFLDTDGKDVTIEEGENGEKTIKNSKGKTILKKEKNEETGEVEITKIESKYIMAYLAAENNTYMISNQNFNMKHFFKNLFSGDETDSDKWGSGMITIEGMNQETLDSLTVDAENAGNAGDSDTYEGQDISNFGKSKNVKIDRENKKMIITRDNHVYQYDLDGWTGKYGKSIEFLLTLHLATMAPDFVYDIVTEEEFDTKVYVALYPVEASIEVVYKTGENEYAIINSGNFRSFGLTQEQWDKIAEYNTDEAQLYTPFITKVIKHWYKDLDFTGCYEEVENDPNTEEDDEKFTYYYPYVGLGEDDDVLANIENLYIREVRQNDFYQVSEPKTKKNERIKQMLLGSTDEEGSENTNEDYLYYLYTGSGMTGNQDEREKNYIIQKVSTGEESTYVMNTKMFTYAFAILEEVHSEDAEFVLRDLKELFRDVEIDVEGILGDVEEEEPEDADEIKPLTWPIEDYKPIVWDPIINGEDVKVNIRHATENTLGFDKGSKVVMPANGKIVNVNRGDADEETGETSGDSVKIEFSGDDREDLEKMYIYIYGIKANEGIENGLYTAGSGIGETIEQDIIIIMTDKNRKAIKTVDKYIVPEDWEALEETDEIGEESDFKNDVFGNGGTAHLQGNYNVNVESGENVFGREDIIKGLEWYRYENPQGYQNIIDNIDYFMAIQSQYGVNAIFGISVAIAESGAGTNWAAIAPYTYNWMSMTGSYNGRSYISPTSSNRRTWRWYNSFGEATLDFGYVIANLPYYFKAGRNTVYEIETPYCPGETWGDRVNEYMTKTIQGIQQY